MNNDELLEKITKILTVILAVYLLYITPENDIYGKPDFFDGIVAGFLLYFVLYLPVLFAVYSGAGITELTIWMWKGIKETVRRPCPQGQADILQTRR